MEKNFECMQPTVDAICKSLIEDSQSWVFTEYTFSRRKSDIEFWGTDSDNAPICAIWNGRSQDRVFSCKQGEQIREAYNTARKSQGSEVQKKVIAEFAYGGYVDSSIHKHWWEFWK